jgi:hypothetical protein
MKFIKTYTRNLLIVAILSISFLNCSFLQSKNEKKLEKLGTTTETKMTVTGMNSNVAGVQPVDAVAFGVNTGEIITNNPLLANPNINVVTPEIVSKVMRQMPSEKISATADSYNINRSDNYYDGAEKMMESQEECLIYSTRPRECVNSSRCGWCNDTNTCVKGGRQGPAGNNCRKESFVYFIPTADWNPLRNNENEGFNIDTELTFHH